MRLLQGAYTMRDYVKILLEKHEKTEEERCADRRLKVIVCYIVAAMLLLMSIVNFVEKAYFMLFTTLFVSFYMYAAGMLCKRLKDYMKPAHAALIGGEVLLLAYVWLGGNDGFSAQWCIAFPFLAMYAFDLRIGFGCSMLLQVFIIAMFWTPLKYCLCYEYSETFLLRFPFLYFMMFSSSAIVNIQLELQRLRQKETQNQLERVSSAKSEFLANMSHEIRTPINVMLGMNEMLLHELDNAEQKEYSENIKTAGNGLLAIVNDILDFSKIESGNMELIGSEYNFGDMLKEIVTMTEFKAKAKGLYFKLERSENIPSVVYGDDIRIRQILNNVLSNAVKYTQFGGITFRIRADFPDSDNTVCFTVEVEDTGIGIKEEDLDKLFEKFQRLDERKNRNIEGSGLGMSITNRLLELMGGDIQVKSKYGEGTRFTVVFRQRVIDKAPVGKTLRQTADENGGSRVCRSFTAPEARVLVVDDVELNLKVARGLLKPFMVQVDTALSGQEAIRLITQNKYDLIFMDQMMPDMYGTETVSKIRRLGNAKTRNAEYYRTVPFVAFTANVSLGTQEALLKEGMQDYIAKPIETSRLEACLRKWLPDRLKVETEKEAGRTEQFGSIPYIEGIDRSIGLNLLGDEELYLETLSMYREAVSDNVAKINAYIEECNWSDYVIVLHSLKSTSKMIGAVRLGDEAAELEAYGKAHDEGHIRILTSRFLESYERLGKALEILQ